MTGPHGWPPLRRRPPRLGKHRALPTVTETPMTPNVAASLPLHLAGPENALPVMPAEPEEAVRCTFCNAVDYVSRMHDAGARPRCADFRACAKRWADGAKPVSLLPHGAEVLEGGPEAQPGDSVDEHLAVFNAAHDEQDAAEAGEPLPDVPGPDAVPHDVPTAAAGGQHHGTAHASTGRSEVNSGPGTPDGGAGLVPDEKAPSGPASPAPSTAGPDRGEGE
jgi:hypothetical protein